VTGDELRGDECRCRLRLAANPYPERRRANVGSGLGKRHRNDEAFHGRFLPIKTIPSGVP
jgi:hypothetical protein